MSKSFISKVIIFLLMFSVVFRSMPVYATDTVSKKKVRVGWYNSDHFQEGFSDEEIKHGYSYDYLQNISSYTGWEYEYAYGGWTDVYNALLNGDIDVLAGVSYTDERAEVINYPSIEMGTEAYYIYKLANNEEISSSDISTLENKRVGTLRNNLMTEYFEKWIAESGVRCIEVFYDDFQARDNALLNGDIDAFIAVNNNVEVNSGFSPVVKVGESEYYLAVAKNRTDLLEELNFAIGKINESNPYYTDSLQLKYFMST
ncbi:MAG: transporter substrate-binding domain-containing protein, partial [Butyrivibrio sp.]|nr:transporter substrate-binding domain-containing protein [Butyrivibrio sp.]